MQIRLTKEKLILYCDKVMEFCVYGFVFFLPISNATIEIFVGWSIFALLVKKIAQKKFSHTQLNIFIAIYFISLVLSAIFSANIGRSFYTIFAKILHYVAFYFVVAEAARNEKVILNTLYVFSASLLLICIDAIQQYFTHFDFIRGRRWPWIVGADLVSGRVNACFTSANGLASYLLPFNILVISFGFFIKKKVYKIILFMIFVLSLISLVLTITRSAWLSFGVGMIVMSFLCRERLKVFLGLLIFFFLGIGMLMLVNDLFKFRILNLFSTIDASSNDRNLLWQMSLNMFKDSPIWGQGIGTFMQNFSKYTLFPAGKQICYAHNSYLQLLAETGILGLGSFLAIIFVALYKSIKKYLSSDREGINIIHLGFISALIAFLIHAFFDNHFYSLTFSLLFWFLVGVNISFLKDTNDKKAASEHFSS